MEAVLLEAARRVDEWPHILTKLPSPQALLAPITTLPTSLDERSQMLLSRLRSPMRLAELVACGRLPEYEVYEIVAAAVEAGLTSILEMPRPVETPKPVPTATTPSTPAARPVPRRRLGLGIQAMPQPSILFWALAIIALGCGLTILGLRGGGSRAARTEIEVYTARATLQRDLETYRALQGRYPAALEELSDMQLTSPSVVEKAGVAHYTRGARGKSFDIDYSGADKKH